MSAKELQLVSVYIINNLRRLDDKWSCNSTHAIESTYGDSTCSGTSTDSSMKLGECISGTYAGIQAYQKATCDSSDSSIVAAFLPLISLLVVLF